VPRKHAAGRHTALPCDAGVAQRLSNADERRRFPGDDPPIVAQRVNQETTVHDLLLPLVQSIERESGERSQRARRLYGRARDPVHRRLRAKLRSRAGRAAGYRTAAATASTQKYNRRANR